MRVTRYRAFTLLLWLVSLGLLVFLWFQGSKYYLTPLIERPRHEAYWTLKPGGPIGRAYGIVGASMMVAMQVYSVRKRARPLRNLGLLRHWLDFHIFCGVIGPLFILLHTSFKIHGLVAVSFWSMVIVAASGVLGRFLYLQIPRRRSGDELSLQEVRAESAMLAGRLRSEFGLDQEAIDRLDDAAVRGLSAEISLGRLLLRLPFEGILLRRRLAAELGHFQGLPRKTLKSLVDLSRQRAQLQRRVVLMSKLQSLFYYWHVFHKPFAIVMYVFMFVHIGVALMTGYAWGGS
jgi:hypothetical protein